MYELGGKVLFMGVGLKANTFHHFVEALYSEKIISLLDGSPKKDELLSLLVTHAQIPEHARQLQEEENGGKKHTLIRFQFGKPASDKTFPKNCQLKTAYCGSSLFTLMDIRTFVDEALDLVTKHPEYFYCDDVLDWISKAKALKND
jgi:aminoglycoside N3'-acetyltransferase